MTRRRLDNSVAVALCSAGVIAFTAACGGEASKPAANAEPAARKQAKIQRALDRLTATEAPGASALVRDGNRTTRLTSGYGDAEKKTPICASDRCRIGSVTKTFVATVALQLVGEGRLALGDTVERWLPGLVPNGNNITVRELLNHTSGLFDVTNDQGFIARVLWKRTEAWTPRKLVRIATAHKPLFDPGATWSYSNTGYMLLGLIVEAASGNPIETELDRRIFRPLRLRATSFASSPHITMTYAHGYLPLDGSRPRDASVFSQSSAWAAGAIVSTADDLATFYRALVRGRLLRPRLLRAMETTVPVAEDPHGGGSGLGLFETGLSCGRVWGHEAPPSATRQSPTRTETRPARSSSWPTTRPRPDGRERVGAPGRHRLLPWLTVPRQSRSSGPSKLGCFSG
jgi:D-alanyl-D-alanine carboxypeptidase